MEKDMINFLRKFMKTIEPLLLGGKLQNLERKALKGKKFYNDIISKECMIDMKTKQETIECLENLIHFIGITKYWQSIISTWDNEDLLEEGLCLTFANNTKKDYDCISNELYAFYIVHVIRTKLRLDKEEKLITFNMETGLDIMTKEEKLVLKTQSDIVFTEWKELTKMDCFNIFNF